MKLTALAAIAALIALSGCASIVKGTTQSVGIVTPPATGATCTLTNGKETWEVVSPGVVTISRSKHDVQVRCTKSGWQDADAVIPSTFEGWTLGNLIFGGVIGVGIDAATGAMNEYPNSFQVPMTRAVGASSDPGHGAGS